MMLAQTLVLVSLLALFATSAMAGIAGVARAQSATAAQALLVPAIETAIGRYQREAAAVIAAQRTPDADAAFAAPQAIAALNGGVAWSEKMYREAAGGDSPLRASVDVLPTALSVPTCATASSGPDTARDLQCSPFVQESRLSLTVMGDAGPADASGAISALAHTRTIVTLRLFAQPPYSAVAGVKVAADPESVHEGDTGGFGNAVGAFAHPPPDDTTIHVVYECVSGSGSCDTSLPLPADVPASAPWTNGNGSP